MATGCDISKRGHLLTVPVC